MQHVNEAVFRVWRLYMAACVIEFENGKVGVQQILASKRRHVVGYLLVVEGVERLSYRHMTAARRAISGYRRFSSAMPTISMMTPAAIASKPPRVSGAANNITAPRAMSSAATSLLNFMGRRYAKLSAGA